MIYDLNADTARSPDEIVRELEATGDYRILKRLKAHDEFTQLPADQPTKIAIILDVETTGLDSRTDQVIELGMIKFSYTTDGRVVRVLETFSAFQEPTIPIPKEITNITGITDDMVAGHHIEPAKISEFVDRAELVIAHNAKFDRPFAERKWPVFENVPWCCSLSQLDWRGLAFDGVRLTHLLAHIGKFHEAHRALDDCRALLEVLAHELPGAGKPTMSLLLDEANRKTVRIWAQGAPFDLKEELKRRKYKWNDGSDGRPKSWFIDVNEKLLGAELEYLRKEIYRRDVDLNFQTMDALTRFSSRI
jgi:DNA polymerase-3 subunit epsilon